MMIDFEIFQMFLLRHDFVHVQQNAGLPLPIGLSLDQQQIHLNKRKLNKYSKAIRVKKKVKKKSKEKSKKNCVVCTKK